MILDFGSIINTVDFFINRIYYRVIFSCPVFDIEPNNEGVGKHSKNAKQLEVA